MKNRKINVALAQFEPVWKGVHENVQVMLDMIAEAGRWSTDLIVFPELSRTGYVPKPSAEEIAEVAEILPSEDSRRIAQAAEVYGLAVVYGTLEKTADGRAYNSTVWLENGHFFFYRKTHIHWTENFVAGDSLAVFTSRIAKSGALICFDLGFPEAARTLALNGAELIVAPSAVPVTFKEINRRRLMARAMDNQIFVIYSNYTGEKYQGGSLVARPSGESLFEASAEPGVYGLTIDLGEIAYWRDYERLYPHRRPDVYGMSR
ncbi:carbon-nitrogen hydrolase family protein [candidate division KSB1 bacterium]|nr:carbon-nitrogen hydrolase family protein [candidate division KSB1 bacterium]NIR71903.1 carbon-nitrogen hydrolase family protein [candidate division KSB1 bacterium]NIS23793.1 carbon-nitrogen hydrolase family protein [candidate division KSB1 bacterium]NIT70716.1 carbon-nitrogen hydrolase family protein [candidate division KSB1 bacterium]NIU24443.1 carbon-nitrogen hydrolase family protein [candidate division KSB1 bacterium]